MYTGMAIRVIQDLGMQHEASIQQDGTLIEVARRRLLFWSVFFLDRVISYGASTAAVRTASWLAVPDAKRYSLSRHRQKGIVGML